MKPLSFGGCVRKSVGFNLRLSYRNVNALLLNVKKNNGSLLMIQYYAINFNRSFYCQFCHHTSHFSLGFILLPSAQLKAFENSLELLRVPMILKHNLMTVKLEPGNCLNHEII